METNSRLDELDDGGVLGKESRGGVGEGVLESLDDVKEGEVGVGEGGGDKVGGRGLGVGGQKDAIEVAGSEREEKGV